ncbi:low temperature/osmotic stress-responsive two component signal transduction system histidine kinase with PAS domain NblS [Thermosynechococcus sp. NK55a]|jgi:two-component system sensor histidine kinase NblS|uniref:two-component system sensor histidine kinase NblS n=1 Tax=Thermosynechococcus sp. NK55a TaxID=1394889 RepID=UPI0003D89815|nr:ATP-binding protein [Thermosynechococcus sp. NK55a]AHB88698.1 low temperature/osmotic stress-responsive two component signal transduction system histidine kinase with PAS domain NblS [Thermosynechococcus sp. NK55a]
MVVLKTEKTQGSLSDKLRGIVRWWSEFKIQTRLMATATLVVSIIMSGLTFWAVNTIQTNAHLNDTRYGRDLGLLLAADVAPLVAKGDTAAVAEFSRKFYERSASIRYILYADPDGEIYYGLPYSAPQVESALTLRRRIQLPETYRASQEPLVRQHQTPNGLVADVFVPLTFNGENLGVVALGINPNPTFIASANLTRDLTIAVFVSLWIMVILGGVFNALTITQPIKELVQGVKNIAAGNFKQRIHLPFGGELGELITSFNDMAERLASYEAQNIEELQAEKAKLDTLVSTIADGAILLDTDMRIILVNPTAQRLFNWEGMNVIGQNALDCFPAPVCEKLTCPLYKASRGESEGGEFRVTLQEPSSRSVRILLTTVMDVQREKPKGIAITIQDITREVELNEAKAQLISNVSHELRTPLFNIKSIIETIQEYGSSLSEKEQQEFLETANHETDRLTRLVNDFLDISRLESGRPYQFGSVQMAQVIDQIMRTYQLNAANKSITLTAEVENPLPPVWGNYDLLIGALTNLVGNALKFTPENGRVTIRAYVWHPPSDPEQERVRIEVADTGMGIAPEDQPRVFERFFRVENRVHTLEGTGLGLAIVQDIIHKHNTQIHLVSELGVGSTFWFDLAIDESALIDNPHGTAETALPPA